MCTKQVGAAIGKGTTTAVKTSAKVVSVVGNIAKGTVKVTTKVRGVKIFILYHIMNYEI